MLKHLRNPFTAIYSEPYLSLLMCTCTLYMYILNAYWIHTTYNVCTLCIFGILGISSYRPPQNLFTHIQHNIKAQRIRILERRKRWIPFRPKSLHSLLSPSTLLTSNSISWHTKYINTTKDTCNVNREHTDRVHWNKYKVQTSMNERGIILSFCLHAFSHFPFYLFIHSIELSRRAVIFYILIIKTLILAL